MGHFIVPRAYREKKKPRNKENIQEWNLRIDFKKTKEKND
jgi:hypothetical protein